MAQINTKDLDQILIKETTADTNDVFNVLISQGAKGGLAVAAQLINVLNISIPFHHVPRSLNTPSLPLVPSLCHSLSLSLQTPFQSHLRQPMAPPPPYKVNLKVCKVVLLCVLTSCGHCVLNQRKIKDGVKTNNRILASSVWKSIVFHTEKYTLSITQCFEEKALFLSSMYRLMMSNHWKGISGLLIWNFIFSLYCSLCIVLFWKNRLKGGACRDLKKKRRTKTNPHVVNFLCRDQDKRVSVVSRQQWKKKKHIKTSDTVASCEW